MRIVVPIKQVPETKSVKMDEKTGTVIREGVEAIINPLDLYAIEIAVQLKAKYNGVVTAISMGPPKAEKALREAIAMGADDAILVSDKAFAGSDTWATSYILGEAIKKVESFDLIICGERATDGDTGQVGPEIAAHLDLPVTSYVCEIEGVENNQCLVKRLTEEGVEGISMTLPGLLTVVKEVSEPSLPTYRGKKRAKAMDIPIYGMDELKLDQDKIGLKGSPTRVVKIYRPKVTRKCEMITASDENALSEAADAFAKAIA